LSNVYAHEDKVHVHAIQLSTCLFIPKTMVQWRRVKHMLPQQIRNGVTSGRCVFITTIIWATIIRKSCSVTR